jgi:hypothetical protein
MRPHSHDRKHTAAWGWGIVRGTNGLMIFMGKKHIHLGGKK